MMHGKSNIKSPKMCLHAIQRKTHLFSNWGLENKQLTDHTALLSAIVSTQFPSLGFLNWRVATQNKGRDTVYWGFLLLTNILSLGLMA
jgi:hypothetical protein